MPGETGHNMWPLSGAIPGDNGGNRAFLESKESNARGVPKGMPRVLAPVIHSCEDCG